MSCSTCTKKGTWAPKHHVGFTLIFSFVASLILHRVIPNKWVSMALSLALSKWLLGDWDTEILTWTAIDLLYWIGNGIAVFAATAV